MSATLPVLCVQAGGRAFGLDATLVTGVGSPARWARLPGAPEYVEGVTELRGQVVSVVDLARRLRLAPGEVEASAGIVVVESAEPVALRVEGVRAVERLDPRLLLGAGERARRAGALGWVPGGMVVLDAEALVDGRRLESLAPLLEHWDRSAQAR